MILHIGTNKTGSKAFQDFLAVNEQALRNKGVVWPSAYRDDVWHRRLFDDFHTGMIDVLKQEMLPYKYAFISYEGAYLSHNKILSSIVQLCDQITVVIFVRNQIDWINSVYNQLFKSHLRTFKSIRDFQIYNTKVLQTFDLNLSLLRWEQYIDRSQIKVIPYCSQKHPFLSFLEYVDLRQSLPENLVYQTKNFNMAADIRSLKILYSLKLQMGEDNLKRLKKAVSIAHQRLGEDWIDTRHESSPMLLGASDVKFIEKTFALSNRALCTRYEIDSGWLGSRVAAYAQATPPNLGQLSDEEDIVANQIYLASAKAD